MPIDFSNFDINDLTATLNQLLPWNVQTGLFATENVQATTSSALQSRSESAIAINPKNPKNMIGTSKKFIDPAIYLFKLGVIYTFDGGKTWNESELPMKAGWDAMTDPTVAFDDFGNAFLVGEPLKFNQDKVGTKDDLTGLGMVVYRSQNGGVTWQQPIQLTTDTSDDKQWVVCDNHPSSRFYGNIYIAWAAYSPLRFCRSTDHGATWIGKEQDPPGASLVSYAFSPELSVSSDGTLHILWHTDYGNTDHEISYLRSSDGGNTFEPIKTVVTGMSSLRGHLPLTGAWPHFDYGKFRVITVVTDCVVANKVLVVAWADMREGRSRIYYRRSLDNGLTWEGPASGQPLLPHVTYGDMHCFHPQIVATATGVVGCAFYVFGQETSKWLIRVQLAASWDHGTTFSSFLTVTDKSWDPLVNAPFAHGDSNVHFIGEYFGLDATDEHFALLWTDTRTGVQELFSDVVQTKRIQSRHIPQLVADVLLGVAGDGGGVIIVGGKIVRVPPRPPIIEALSALATFEAVDWMPENQHRELQLTALKAARNAIDKQIDEITDLNNVTNGRKND